MLKVVPVLLLIVHCCTMAIHAFKYNSNQLKATDKSSKIANNYSSFCLEPVIRRKIIELGIPEHHQHYRRFRGGRNLFHMICTIITEAEQRKQHYDWIDSTATCNISNECQPDNTLPRSDNCHSIVSKTADLKAKISYNNIDICALTETWIKQDNNITVVNMCPAGYSAIFLPRPDYLGEGIAITHIKNISVSTYKSYSFDSMECCNFSIATSKTRPKDHFIVIYRPPNLSILAFLHNCATVMEGNIMESGHLTIPGDLNIKINHTHGSDLMLLLDFLDSCDLSNKSNVPNSQAIKHHSPNHIRTAQQSLQ